VQSFPSAVDGLIPIEVDALSGIETNARQIRDRVAAVVSAAGAVGGSALANDASQWQTDLLRFWRGAECDEGDGRGVESLSPDVRKRWLEQNPLPAGIRYYSLVTLPTPDRVSNVVGVSKIIGKSYRQLGAIDWRNARADVSRTRGTAS